jgi:limonene-1,2-epoxide hydrolase
LLEAAAALTDRLRHGEDRTRTVHVRIGIEDADGSQIVCERVYAAVLEHLRESEPLLEPRIEVTVVAIG